MHCIVHQIAQKYPTYVIILGQKSKFSLTPAGPYCQRTLHTKYVAAYKTQRFQFFEPIVLEEN